MASFATHFYFSPRGRTGRALYWMFGVLPFVLAGILLGLLARIFRLPQEAVLVLLSIITLSGLWTWICISSRRLHDFNQSAWWLLLAFALPFTILLVAPYSVAQISSLIVLVVLGAIPGTVGSNYFGADPNARRPNPASEPEVRPDTSPERTRSTAQPLAGMKQVAIATCWLVIVMNLAGAYRLAQSNAAGIATIIPMLMFGATLIIHHGKYARPLMVWGALSLIFLWGVLGLVAVVYLLVMDPAKPGMALFLCVFTLVPSIPNVIALFQKRNRSEAVYAS